MTFIERLKNWLTNQRLNLPEHDRAEFTREVMNRIESPQTSPAGNWRLSFGLPRLAFALGSVAAGMLIAVVLMRGNSNTASDLAMQETAVTEEAALLLALAELDEEVVPEELIDAWALGIDETKLMVMAQSTETNDQWLEQTLYLLEVFDEGIETEDGEAISEEELLMEMQILDEVELGATS